MTDAESPCGRDCAQALAQLCEYLELELGELDVDRVRQHLGECEGCLTEYLVEIVLKRVVRRCCAEHAPDALRLRIHERLAVWTDPA